MSYALSINAREICGPYGGGNQFVLNLCAALRKLGWTVTDQLIPGLDIIIIATVMQTPAQTTYDWHDVEAYRKAYPGVLVLHRINTCDEPRGRDWGINREMLAANAIADHTVFVSAFVRDLFYGHGFDASRPHSVIHTGANRELFHSRSRASFQPGEKLELVTHHHSRNFLKGFDIYERLDLLLEREPYRDRFGFTFIGRENQSVRFRNARVLPMTSGVPLVEALHQSHAYITAARHEPAGNHYIEALACGLPVLYLESGSSGEYCGDYGLGFTPVDFEEQLLALYEQAESLRDRVLSYTYGAEDMVAAYVSLLESMLGQERPAGTRSVSSWKRIAYGLHRIRRHLGQARRALGEWLVGV